MKFDAAQVHGNRKSADSSDGQEIDPLHHPGDLGRQRDAVPADDLLPHDRHPGLQDRRGPGHMLRSLLRRRGAQHDLADLVGSKTVFHLFLFFLSWFFYNDIIGTNILYLYNERY